MKMAQLPFLNHVVTHRASEKVNSQSTTFTEDDDLDLCLYYLRTLHNVLKISGDMSRAVLASKYVSFSDGSAHIRGMSLISCSTLVSLLTMRSWSGGR